MENIDKYRCSSNICKLVYAEIVEQIREKQILDVLALSKYGERRIVEECEKVFKNVKRKGVAFPVSISLNDCVGNYIYEPDNDNYNCITKGDVVKIELGVDIAGCITILGETIVYDNGDTHNDKIQLLEELKGDITSLVFPSQTNDELRIHIESKCTEINCFPTQNCTSFQQIDGHLESDDSKYMILNYRKKYDINEYLLSMENLCFEFEVGEVYNINLTVTEESDVTYKTPHDPHIYRFNENYYNLKLKSAKTFLSQVKSIHGNNAFFIQNYNATPSERLGFKECFKNMILTDYPVIYTRSTPVFHKKFTIIVTENKCIIP